MNPALAASMARHPSNFAPEHAAGDRVRGLGSAPPSVPGRFRFPTALGVAFLGGVSRTLLRDSARWGIPNS